jgi:hypothetical protein
MLWVFMGLAGLIWAAKEDAGPILLDPRMPSDLKSELLAALARDLREDQLEALAGVLRRAHYTRAAEIFALRRLRTRGPASSAAAGGAGPRESTPTDGIRTLLAGEDDADVLDKVAQTVKILGLRDLAAELEQRLAVLQARYSRTGRGPAKSDDDPRADQADDEAVSALAQGREHQGVVSNDRDALTDAERDREDAFDAEGGAIDADFDAEPRRTRHRVASPADVFELARRELLSSDEEGGLQ